MPMYFPDLKSVQQLAKTMGEHKGDKKYTGIYPKTEKDLPEARVQLGRYLRGIWNDGIFAMEVELGVSKENYDAKMKKNIFLEMFNKGGK